MRSLNQPTLGLTPQGGRRGNGYAWDIPGFKGWPALSVGIQLNRMVLDSIEANQSRRWLSFEITSSHCPRPGVVSVALALGLSVLFSGCGGAIGTACKTSMECGNAAQCVDGVCCASSCDGACMACSAAKTGTTNGTCAPVSTGTDPDDECTDSGCGTGQCGSSGACTPKPLGSSCRVAAGACDVVESCDGTSLICPDDTFAPAATSCRPAVSVCDVPEQCSGTSAQCPSDVVAPASVECRASAGVCDVAERCSGTSPQCPSDAFEPTTFECRASAGVCDVADNCSGTSAACPDDALAPMTVQCRASTAACDAAEFCSGTATNCPPDALSPATQECRAAADACDAPERCTGTSIDCPNDSVLAASTVCRVANGTCDVAERCDGVAKNCPQNAFAPSLQQCRSSAGICDVVETCTGSGPDCPPDAFAAASVVCRAQSSVCDVEERCTGQAAMCPAEGFAASGTICRSPAGVCDAPEACTGTGPLCPVDVKRAATTLCRADAGPCDVAEYCTGSGNSCPTDTFASATSLNCAPNRCTGFSAACTASCADNSGCAPNARSICFNNACATAKLVFVTSTTYPTTIGLDGGDIACATQAADGGLTGTFLPWLSTATVYPRTRFASYSGPYARTDKVAVASNFGDFLDGQILAPILRDERGVQIATTFNVLSGTGGTGIVQTNFPSTMTINSTCNNWTSASASNTGYFGAANSFGLAWTLGNPVVCSAVPQSRLYCFEQ
jgi:hypothetical protein